MLREIPQTRQVPGEQHRRWFTSDVMDLFVWTDASNQPTQLQLCYDKGNGRAERAFTWTQSAGFVVSRVEDGENCAGHKATPVLKTDRNFDPQHLHSLVLNFGSSVPPELIRFAIAKLREFQFSSAASRIF